MKTGSYKDDRFMLGFYLTLIDSDDDKNKFEQLYLTYRQDMYKIAYNILKNSADAEDAVHQAFLSIANSFEKVLTIPRQEIKAYIVIIIRNTSINIYNKNKRNAEHTVELDEKDVPVDINFFEQYEYELLVNAIKELPQLYKDIIYLYYLEEFSTKEISQMLDITVDTVYKRLERAKKLLKTILKRGENYAE